jgi:asparagine synthase (glutamine-hydrolysing)
MCGIAGIISSKDIDKEKVIESGDTLSHRGPDATGTWFGTEQNVAFVHKRLSIIDLSENASQPMFSKDKRFVMVFNGEIYNYSEIKTQLLQSGIKFVTSSDSEVLLELFILKGEKCLDELDGMFAFAIWDTLKKQLFCARDRFGEKPFYYHYVPGKLFVFASEIKFLWEYGVKKEMSPERAYRFLAYTEVNDPTDNSITFFSGIKKLPPSSFACLNEDLRSIEIKKYWDIAVTEKNKNIGIEEAIFKFKNILLESVKLRLRSDVPVGTSLSGGLDSSAIVALIHQLNQDGNIRQKAFSARFKDFDRDEGEFINMIAEKTGVESIFTWPSEDGFVSEFSSLLYHQEEPFQSASIYAQWCVMKLARVHGVKVLLDGQGADEILGGYKKYRHTYMNELFRNDIKLYDEEVEAIQKTHEPAYRHYENYGSSFSKKINRYSPVRKIKTQLKQLVTKKTNPADRIIFPDYFNPDFIARLNETSKTSNSGIEFGSLYEHLYHDTMINGLGTLLNYADKNSMAHSVEVRLPFLSHHLVEFVFSLPSHFKIHDGWSKFIQRRAFENLLPKEISWRKEKVGYEAPQKIWMRNKVISEMMNEARAFLQDEKIINADAVEKPNEWNMLVLAACMAKEKFV